MQTITILGKEKCEGSEGPESGNGIPDILDEVRMELDFLMKMQDRDSGGFYIKVKSRSENNDDGDRTVWVGNGDKCITNATTDCTAGHILKQIPIFLNQLLVIARVRVVVCTKI